MLGGIGPMELMVVLVIALVILGPKRLPDAGKSLGRGFREFKGAIAGRGGDGDGDDDADLRALTAHEPAASSEAARS